MINLFRRIKRLSPLEGYNRWSETYQTEDNPIKRLSDEFIKNELPDLKGKHILDAGCGVGTLCELAISRGASFVKGIDLSPKMIEHAKRNCLKGEFEAADLATDVIDRKYDVVICGLVLGHIESLESALMNLLGALRPGGHVIITDFHPGQTKMKAKRTFSYHGKTFEVQHHLHTLPEYFHRLQKESIKVISIKEPEYNNIPVIFGIHGVRA